MKKLKLFGLLLTISSLCHLKAQEKKTYNVGIVVHEEVELFDFAGPGEVFASRYARLSDIANFKVFTVAPGEGTISSMTFLRVVPNYTIDNVPKIDILIVPGGSTGILYRDSKFMDWVKGIYEDLDHLLTVCTGAHVAATAGFLEGLQATTHHSNLAYLQRLSPTTEVLSDTKFVDSDKIITSGGVSSGIEGSLHLLKRIAGLETAKQVARYMEYDNWTPELGLVSVENEVITELKRISSLNNIEIKSDNKVEFSEKLQSTTSDQVHYGDLEVLGQYFIDKHQLEYALLVFQNMKKIFPKSRSTYSNLSKAYRAMGKDAPLTQEEFFKMVEEKGGKHALAKYEKWQRDFSDWLIFNPRNLNSFGYKLVGQEKLEDALAVFKVQVLAFPDQSNSWDSFGEIYLTMGNKKEALINYEKALEINPNAENAKKMIEKIKKM